jgi:hypothetical protein
MLKTVQSILHKILGILIIVFTALSDLILILCVLIIGYASIWMGAFAALVFWHAAKKTGGLFYAWNYRSIKSFWTNWNRHFLNEDNEEIL